MFGREDPETVEILGKALRCHVCEGDTFYTRKAVLPGAVATFLNFDWAAPSCTCVICSRCGYVHWFFPGS